MDFCLYGSVTTGNLPQYADLSLSSVHLRPCGGACGRTVACRTQFRLCDCWVKINDDDSTAEDYEVVFD